jgi:hypothetical protein
MTWLSRFIRHREERHEWRKDANTWEHQKEFYRKKEQRGIDKATYIRRLTSWESEKSARDGMSFKRKKKK